MKSFFLRHRILIMLSVMVLAFCILSREVYEAQHEKNETISVIDLRIHDYFISLRTPNFTEAAINITALGSRWVLTLIVFMTSIYLLLLKYSKEAASVFITGLGASFLDHYLKNFFEIPRPDLLTRLVEASGYSYPSGHSQASASIYLSIGLILIAHLTDFKAKVVMLMITLLLIGSIGLSRIYLGVHYFSDVSGGFIIGLIWVSTVRLLLRQKSF